MTQSAYHASAGNLSDAYDFNQNHRCLKKLIQELKAENDVSVRREIFGEDAQSKHLTKKQMKQLFRFLRKVEKHYEECCEPPIPKELEESIRRRESSEWLPWEMEALEKVEAWREDLRERKANAREMFNRALEKVRQGQTLP